MSQHLLDYYRFPSEFVAFKLTEELSPDSGYFRFGRDILCYGRSSAGFRAKSPTDLLYDLWENLRLGGPEVFLPFDPDEIIDDLRLERYKNHSPFLFRSEIYHDSLKRAYYLIRPWLPIFARRRLQKVYLKNWRDIQFPHWPVDCTVESIMETLTFLLLKARSIETVPFIWFWPLSATACATVTHDVETSEGRDFCPYLMDLDDAARIKSSFQFIPEKRYVLPDKLLNNVRERGFEINVHDLNHDGCLYRERQEFLRRAASINAFAGKMAADGFRSAGLYRNPNWFDALNISYDMSIPNAGHLEAQRGGCCTVMPYFIGKILELPVTMTQDYSLFYIVGDYSTELWQKELDLVTHKHGLANFIVHADYIRREKEQRVYRALLIHLQYLRDQQMVWIALPGEINAWHRQRHLMMLTRDGKSWRISGPGSERARLAYATITDDGVRYVIDKRE